MMSTRAPGDDPSSAPVPSAPWRAAAEVLVAWVPAPHELRTLLPAGVSPLRLPGVAGRAALAGVRYPSSPVGPYLELSLLVPARLGLRPGSCVVWQVVSSPAARRAYRTNWGLPTTLADLTWVADQDGGPGRELRCESPSLVLRGVPRGPALPAYVPVRSVQRRTDGPVVVPRRFLALVRLAGMTVTVGDAADAQHGFAGFDRLAGVHPGLVLAGARMLARPARHPAGLWSSLRAPLAAPEPAHAGRGAVAGRGGDPRYSGAPHRALSSVG
ncbi:MAG TPA: acetoacetate decarboxylase family protein [Acidimicrobiales bacterium]|nr:acetoacetate decarboxylase family protein [Acidimicrobiales bacterium]